MVTIFDNAFSGSSKRYSLKYLFDNLDLSFVWDVIKEKYSIKARCRFHSPEAMLKALLLKEIRQISSRRKLTEYLKSGEGQYCVSILGFKRPPCHDAFSEFIKRVGAQTFEQIFRTLVQKIRSMINDFGRIIAVDSTSLKAYSHFQKGEKRSDPDAQPGYVAAGTGWVFGYKAHIACDAKFELPIAFTVTSANVPDTLEYAKVLETAAKNGIKFEVTLADAGYDTKDNYLVTIDKYDAIPIIAMNKRNLKKNQKRIFDYFLPITRDTDKWKRYYNMRSAIERVNSRLKEELALKAIKVRGLTKVKIHISISLIALLSISYVSLKTKNLDSIVSVSSFRF